MRRPVVAGARPARVDVSRVLFYTITSCAALGAAFVVGMRAGVNRTAAYFFVTDLQESVVRSLRLLASEAPTLAGTRPTHFLQAGRYAGSGVTVNDASNDQTDVLLLSGFFGDTNELRLIRRNGDVLARWPVGYHELMGNPDFMPVAEVPATDWNIDLHGAEALPDGSVVFNFEYGGTVKLDRCNHVRWTVRRQTHHSIERAESGGFWVPARRVVSGQSPYPPFEPPFNEDTVLHVSDEGEILSEFSVVKLFYDNGLETVLTATGSSFRQGMDWDREVVHLNKVAELGTDRAADFPMFEAGDLVLSMRKLNLVMVVDRTGQHVKWWQIGPWRRQHDPEFARGGRVLLFNNNLYASVFGASDRKTPVDVPLVSEVVAVDPVSRRTETVYGGRPGQEILSVTRGKIAETPRGGLLITEADGGRVRETDAGGAVVWEYVNRYDAEDVAELGEARLYSAGYFNFDVGAWPCGRP